MSKLIFNNEEQAYLIAAVEMYIESDVFTKHSEKFRTAMKTANRKLANISTLSYFTPSEYTAMACALESKHQGFDLLDLYDPFLDALFLKVSELCDRSTALATGSAPLSTQSSEE